MKRRDLLKGLTTMAAGGAFCSGRTWNVVAGQEGSPIPPKLATPIRGLARTDKGLLQPLQLSIQNSGGSGVAITEVDGVEVDRRTVQSGANAFEGYVEPASTNRT